MVFFYPSSRQIGKFGKGNSYPFEQGVL